MKEQSAPAVIREKKRQPSREKINFSPQNQPINAFIEFFAPTFKLPEEFVKGSEEMLKRLRKLGYLETITKEVLQKMAAEANHTHHSGRKFNFFEDVILKKGGLKFFADFRNHDVSDPFNPYELITQERKIGRQIVKEAQERQMEKDRLKEITKNNKELIKNKPIYLVTASSIAS